MSLFLCLLNASFSAFLLMVISNGNIFMKESVWVCVGQTIFTLSHLLKVQACPPWDQRLFTMGPKPGYHGTKARLPV